MNAYPDSILRGMYQVATCDADRPWPAEVVAKLIHEIIRRRGSDRVWLLMHASMYCPECDDAEDAPPNDGKGTP